MIASALSEGFSPSLLLILQHDVNSDQDDHCHMTTVILVVKRMTLFTVLNLIYTSGWVLVEHILHILI